MAVRGCFYLHMLSVIDLIRIENAVRPENAVRSGFVNTKFLNPT